MLHHRHPELVHRLRPDLRDDRRRPGHATELLVTYIYKLGFVQTQFDYAAAVTVVQFLLFSLLAWLANRLAGGECRRGRAGG